MSWALLLLPALLQGGQDDRFELEGHDTYYLCNQRPGTSWKGPTILWLHGMGATPENTYRKWTSVSESKGFLIAALASKDRNWGEADEDVLLPFVEELKKKYRIPLNNLWIAGFSLGGCQANLWGARHSDLFRGVIAMGSGSTAACSPDQAVYILCGEKDGHRQFTRKMYEIQKQAGVKELVYKEIPGLGHSFRTEDVRDVFAWIRKVGPWPEKKGPVGVQLRIGFPEDADVDAVASKVRTLSRLLHAVSKGTLYVSRATLRPGTHGDIVFGTESERRSRRDRVQLDTDVDEILRAWLASKLRAKEDECGCFLTGRGTTLCDEKNHEGRGKSCWERLLRTFRGANQVNTESLPPTEIVKP